MTQVFSGPGGIRLRTDCTGISFPVATAHVMPVAAGDGFILTGDGLAEADSGAVIQSALNGVTRLTTTDEAAHAAILGTPVMFDAGRMGPLVLEARVSMPALTARRVFVGFSGANVAAQSTFVSGSTTTLTLTGGDLAGVFFDSGLTSDNFHTVYNGGATAGVTDSTAVVSSVLPVAGSFNVIRVVAHKNGSVEYWIDGAHIATVDGALSTSDNVAAVVGVEATTTTVATLDVDYVEVDAGRNWDIDNA